MSEIAANLAETRRRIADACIRSGRGLSDVELIAVSKTCPAEAVRDAFEAGQVVFGESRLQEASAKLPLLPGSLDWHFIGRIQRNKARRILSMFSVLHAVDSMRLAQCLDAHAGEEGMFPKVFLEVNVAGEASKGGYDPKLLRSEFEDLLKLRRLEIIGLMCIPPVADDPEESRPWFVALRELRDELVRDHGAGLPFLSMGMSDDFEVAVEEGATHVRVGSAIFGKRSYGMDGGLG